ncbi:large conductance mechanosensitive channel protein MscL [Aquibacillus saliphilus]|uniref:large conductance mechanosensitive channel protein MscL n=1 Tax=Aquibacillus saliphilus TaxID=1909422 RepID=UPI0021077D6B|nr:large conductance mechanosensitive channel protein MscL [Aquibacillus saliphilus]
MKEFRQFVLKGSAADMGIGLVLGAAFSGLIDSFVSDVLLPPVGLLLAKMNFSNLFLVLGGGHYSSLKDAQEAGVATINYGLFITSFIRFIIIVFVIFIMIRQMNRWRRPNQHPVDSMTKKECPFCRLPIPSQAVKCPNCSSELDEQNRSQISTNKSKLRIKIK